MLLFFGILLIVMFILIFWIMVFLKLLWEWLRVRSMGIKLVGDRRLVGIGWFIIIRLVGCDKLDGFRVYVFLYFLGLLWDYLIDCWSIGWMVWICYVWWV